MRSRPLILLALLFPLAVEAQQAIPDTVVTATRIPTPAARIPAAVTVITRQDIQERGYVSLADALAAVPGFHLVQLGGLGQQASGFLRGTASRHVLVLLDGVPLNDPSDPNGAFDFGQELLGDIERIEVVRGPASAMYGSGALGGVVNLVTRHAPAGRAFVPFGELAGGTQRTLRAIAGAAGNAGAWDWMVAGETLSTRGSNVTPPRFTSNMGERDGFRGVLGSARLGGRFGETAPGSVLGETRIEGWLRWRENTTGLDNVPNDDPNFTGQDRLWFGALRAETALFGGAWTTGLRASVTESRRRYSDLPDSLNAGSTYDLYRGRRSVLDWGNTLRAGSFGAVQDLAFTFGVTHEQENADSVSGNPPFATTVNATQRNTGLHAGVQFRLFERLDLSAGLRHDAPSGFDDATTWRLGAVLALPEIASRLRASAGTAFKAPSLFQRFGVTGTIFRGNPDLRPERAFAWDVGVETDIARWATVSATYFNTRIRDLINFDAGFSTLENVDRAKIQGVELGLTLRPARWLSATAAWTITEARDAATDQPLPRRPKNVASLILRFAPVPEVVIAPEILFTGRSLEGPFASYANDGTPNATAQYNKPGTVLNLTGSWQALERVALFVEGRNLTNTRFEPANGFVIPGRSLILGARATF